MPREDFSFGHVFRVRYMEVDPQLVVFNARILDYTDNVLVEFWRSRGMSFTGPGAFEVHVVQARADYLRPLRFDECIEGLMRVTRFGSSSLTTLAEFHGPGDDDLRARVELTQVHVDLASGRPVRIPDEIRDKLGEKSSG